MEKIKVEIIINDYKITSIGTIKNNIIKIKDNDTELEYDLNSNILKRENNEMKQTINFKENEFKYLLKEIKQELNGKIKTLSLTNKDKQVNIVYCIEENNFYLKLKYEIIR